MMSLNLTPTDQRQRRIENLMHEMFGGYTRAEAEIIIDNPDGFGDVIKARRLNETIAQAQEVIERLPEVAKKNAYVYHRVGSDRFGFFFAADDAQAEKYRARCEQSEDSRWLLVATVPGK